MSLMNCSKEAKMSALVLSTDPSNTKEEFMTEIKASILNRSGRKYWYIRYQMIFNKNEISKPIEKSTKVSQKEKGLSYMEEVFLPAWIKRKKEELHTKSIKDVSFAHYAKLYNSMYSQNRDLINMGYRLKRILAEFGNKDITAIKKLEIKVWLNELKHTKTGEILSKNTRNKYKTIFNEIFSLALDDEIIEKNYIPEIQLTDTSRKKNVTKPFSKDEVSLLLEKSEDTERYGNLLHLYLGCALNQGWSPSEAIGIQISDISTDLDKQNTIKIQRDVTKNHIGQTKNTYREREIVLRNQSMQYIDELIKLAKEKNSIWLFSDINGEYIKDIANIRGTPKYINKQTNRKV